jgi:hypothetical protein
MRIEVIPLDFMGQLPLIEPKDRKLHDMAVEYASRELAETVDFSRLAKVWVTCVMQAGKPKEVIGLMGWVYKPDIPVFRVSGPNAARATKMMTDRLHSFFSDQGARGCEVFIHISSKEKPEQKCAKWQESLKATNATPADRFSITVR